MVSVIRGNDEFDSGQVGVGFESAEISLVQNTTITVAHGLGQTPKQVQYILRCKTADGLYVPGDEVYYDSNFRYVSTAHVVGADATYLFSNTWGGWEFAPKNGGSYYQILSGNQSRWRIVFRAYL